MRLQPTRREQVLLGVLLLAVAAGVVSAPRLLHEYRLSKGRHALRSYDLDAAFAWLELAAAGNPNCPRTQFLLARANRRRGNLVEVREHLERAWQLDYPVEAVQREELLVQAQLGQMTEAEPKLREHLGKSGEDTAEICEALVNGYLRNYRFDDAARWLDAWQADFAQAAQPHYFRGRLWQHLMMWNEAAEEFQTALDLAPRRADIRSDLCEVLMQLHKYDQASALFQQTLDRNPLESAALVGQARCLMAQGEVDAPRAMFEKALRSDPDNFSARMAMGQLAMSEGKASEALRWLEPAFAERPNDLVVRYELAQALQAAGRAEEARQHYAFVDEANDALTQVRKLMQKIQQTPDLVEPRYEIGSLLLKYSSPADGIAWLYSVLELESQHRATHQLLAAHYASQQQAELAERHRRLAEMP